MPDFSGLNDDTLHCRTHLGHVLNIGDSVLGLDLKNSNVNNPELEKMATDKVDELRARLISSAGNFDNKEI